jgi:hypothetical protein
MKNNPLEAGYFFDTSIRGAIRCISAGFVTQHGFFGGSRQRLVALAAVFTKCEP